MNISSRLFNLVFISLALCGLYLVGTQYNTAQENTAQETTPAAEAPAVETNESQPVAGSTEQDEPTEQAETSEPAPTTEEVTPPAPEGENTAPLEGNNETENNETEIALPEQTEGLTPPAVEEGTVLPVPGSPTPGSPTPGSPTPGSPTPGSPTPGPSAPEEASPLPALNAADAPAEEAEEEVKPLNVQGMITLGVLILLIAVTYWLGHVCAQKSRLPEHSFKIFIVLLAFFGGIAALALGWNRLTLGIDLQGGVVLVYDAKPIQRGGEQNADPNAGLDMDQLTRAIGKRINPGGVREIAITQLGQRQVQVVIPHAEAAEVARIERVVSESGALTFRILASRAYPQDEDIIKRGEASENSREILDSAGKVLARWVPVFETQKDSFTNPDMVTRPRGNITEVLVKWNDGVDITGEYLTNIGRGMGKDGRPGVSFSFNAVGANKCARMTGANLPDQIQERLQRHMGIVLNDSLYSAPVIEARIAGDGIITLQPAHTQAQQQQLNQDIEDLIGILDAGALPAELSKEPVGRMLIGATLGNDTIQKAQWALTVAAVATVLFMIFYYRLAGCIAAFCVITNTILIVAIMIALRAAFTLPGLAGLVLTIGMAVDANILIYERIREELAGGASLKMAIRNGYAKAFSAIFDSNITTILVGCILYAVGTEQVKGFAVTLVLGITLNLFTAIYCARVIMEVLASQRWVKTFNMMQMFQRPNINFLKARWACATFSIVLVLIGLVAVGARGRGLLDIDFVGGISVEAVFKQTQDITQIREKLYAKDATIAEEENRLNDLSVQNVQMNVDDQGNEVTPNTHFIITSSIPQVQERTPTPDAYLATARNILKDTFGDQLEYCSMEYKIESTKKVADYDETVVQIKRYPKSNHDALMSEINAMVRKAAADKLISGEFSAPTIARENFVEGDQQAFDDWTATFRASNADIEKVLAAWKTELDGTPNFPTSTTVGGSVARNTRIQGSAAILGSLIAMVIYIAIRFHRLVYGLIAVMGLLHVVLVVLGLLAISRWCTTPLLQIEEFKIGLPVVAAFLTLIGYAINDTIILFDRIRENLGKSTVLTGTMINTAINQTLSRTVLTSLTTFFVAFILYLFGGQGIHTFAFAISAGVFFGTYSTIGICASLLFWAIGKDDLKPGDTMKIEKM